MWLETASGGVWRCAVRACDVGVAALRGNPRENRVYEMPGRVGEEEINIH